MVEANQGIFFLPIDALYKLVFALLKLPVAQNNKQLYIFVALRSTNKTRPNTHDNKINCANK